MATRPKYPGELGKPVPLGDVLAVARKAKAAKLSPNHAVRQWEAFENERRLRLLLSHFGISKAPDCWKLLAQRLDERRFQDLLGFVLVHEPGRSASEVSDRRWE